ncbi:hypothetical protein AAC387_Pa10g0681 [Persea americana]
MRERLSLNLQLFIFFLCLYESNCVQMDIVPDSERNSLPLLYQHVQYQQGSLLVEEKADILLPDTSPTKAPQPFIPLLAPSPLTPYTNNTMPRLSGLCTLKFSAADSMISTTAVDCLASFAPFLANVICCPQLQATLVILIGQSSKDSGTLALDMAQAMHCLSDVQEILTSQGANETLQTICSVYPSNLTEASCPVKDVNDFESIVDSTTLLAACEKVDPVNECCTQICQNAISEAARKIASRDGLSGINDAHILPGYSARLDDCKSIVLRWLASRIDPLPAKQVLRRISNCNLNKFCPLIFPDTQHVAKRCGNGINNKTACCSAMAKYISHLQKQSFITNLQALDCAALLGRQLQKMNISANLYDLCHISLKDFSLQESGCLLPSLPSDITLDQYTGIGFICDLNDNIAAPWPSTSQLASVSSCNKTVKMPALPAATTSGNDQNENYVMLPAMVACFMIVAILK